MNSVYVPNTLSTGVHFVFLYCQLCLNKRVYNLVRRGRGGRPSRCHRAVAPWEAANAAVPCVARRNEPYGTVAGLFGAAEDSGDGEIFPEAEIRSGASMKGIPSSEMSSARSCRIFVRSLVRRNVTGIE
jgi:hypothetical protein